MPYPETRKPWVDRDHRPPKVEHQYRIHKWTHNKSERWWGCRCGAYIYDHEVMKVAVDCHIRLGEHASMDMIYFLRNSCRDDGSCP